MVLAAKSQGPTNEEEIFTVLEAQGSCFHCAGWEGCGYQTGWAQLPQVVRSSRTWEGQHREQASDHLGKKNLKTHNNIMTKLNVARVYNH